ncbi:hypothetical protein AAG570_004134, partial [Ranatra chinensis]
CRLGFEIVPVALNENKSPVIHSEHWLGLQSWCVPHVYCNAYNRIMAIRQNNRRKEDHAIINRLLMGVLMINPNITTFWNMRKDQMESDKLDPDFELRFTALALSWKPNCADIFAHRKWIIQRLLKGGRVESELLDGEMAVCELAADHYSNNYHAWTHRLWSLQRSLDSCDERQRSVLLEREWEWSEHWVSRHVSDHSGLHYRQRLLSILQSAGIPSGIGDKLTDVTFGRTSSPSVDVTLAFSELRLVSDLIRNFPGHEALWVHRRFVLASLRRYLSPPPGEDVSAEVSEFLTRYEESFLGASSGQATYVERHRRWLVRALGLDLSKLLK